MKQLNFTDEQRELLKKMDALFQEARDKDISFLYDISDGSLTAFNSANVLDSYASCYVKESEADEEIDFEKCHVIYGGSSDYCDYSRQNYYLRYE